NLNASYVNEKIKFSDDYFQEIINPDFGKIDSSFQQTSSLKPYVSAVILEKIIIDLEDEVIVQIYLWIIDSGCSKHMMGNHALLTNFMEKFLGTVRFGNNDFAVIAGYGDVESSSSSLNDDVQQSSKEVGVPSSNTLSVSNNMVPNVDEASTSHNMFNKRLEDAYFDASTLFHDPSNVHIFYQRYPHEKKWTKDHPLQKIIGGPKSSVCTRGQVTNSCLLNSIEPANVAEALRDANWVSAMQEKLDQ
nr:Gag-Pol polyprotein [Tanacetum cinerariifolium]